MFSALMTSTMKSPPGRSVVSTSTSPDGSTSLGNVGAVPEPAGPLCCAAASPEAPAPPTNTAAPVTAALFRKPRRPTDGFFDIVLSLNAFIGDSLHPTAASRCTECPALAGPHQSGDTAGVASRLHATAERVGIETVAPSSVVFQNLMLVSERVRTDRHPRTPRLTTMAVVDC